MFQSEALDCLEQPAASHLFARRALEGAALAPLASGRVAGEVSGQEQVLEGARLELGDEAGDVAVIGVGSRAKDQACVEEAPRESV